MTIRGGRINVFLLIAHVFEVLCFKFCVWVPVLKFVSRVYCFQFTVLSVLFWAYCFEFVFPDPHLFRSVNTVNFNVIWAIFMGIVQKSPKTISKKPRAKHAFFESRHLGIGRILGYTWVVVMCVWGGGGGCRWTPAAQRAVARAKRFVQWCL